MYSIRDSLVSIRCSHADLLFNCDNKKICLAVLDLMKALDWLCKILRTPLNADSYFVLSASYCLERVTIAQDSVHGSSQSSMVQLYTLRLHISLKTSCVPIIKQNC